MLCKRRILVNVPIFLSTLRKVHHTPKELSIKVPWGIIAGLHWNDKPSAVPVLCAHGWKDNAASFNRLLPLILQETTDFQFIAIDLPGHGRTSHYPSGMMYHYLDILANIRRVIEHFGWLKKYSDGIHLVGHSFGAQALFLFTATHPEIVKSLVVIDALIPLPFQALDIARIIVERNVEAVKYTEKSAINTIRMLTDGLLTFSNERKSKTLSRDELLDKHIKHTKAVMMLDDASCEILFNRAVHESPPGSGKWRFSHDPRTQLYPLTGLSPKQLEDITKGFQSNLLYIEALLGSGSYPPVIMEWIKKDNPKVVHKVTAKKAFHHVHLTEPESIMKDIVKFLKEAK